MASGSFTLNRTGNTSKHITLTCNWTSTSNGSAANSSTVKVTIVASKSLSSNESTCGNYSVSANVNDTIQNTESINFALAPGASITLLSKSYTVPHNADGTKNTTISVIIDGDVIHGNASNNITLDKISRYASVTQLLNNNTETSITISWSSDSLVDCVWYSTNNGTNWSNAINVNSKSGNYTINGLNPETSYNLKTRVKRKDSQLLAESKTLVVKTYSYPYAKSMPNFTIGSKITLEFYNPLGRNITVNLLDAGGKQICSDITTGTLVSGYNDHEVINKLYASIPCSKSGTYRVKVTYGTHVDIRTGGTYTVNKNDCEPTIGECSYLDTNNASTSITKNNQLIIRNQSKVQLTATNLNGNKSASIASCKVLINANTYIMNLNDNTAIVDNIVIDSSRNVDAIFTITDSRGIEKSHHINIIMLNWTPPTAIINLHRQNNFHSKSDINVNAAYSNINGKNSIEIKTRYKKTNEIDYGQYILLQNNATSTLTLDNLFEWNVQIVINDRFASKTYNLTLGKGMPIMFIDRKLSSIGFNCFPKNEKSVEINGINLTNNIMTACLNEEKTNLKVNAYTIVPFTNSNGIGNRLTFFEGGIKIGTGVNYIKVSATLKFNQIKSNAIRHIRIMKNDSSDENTLGWAQNYMVGENPQIITIPPILATVQMGDIVHLWYFTADSNDVIGGSSFGNITSLTIETVG